jgi:hypothetical protein
MPNQPLFSPSDVRLLPLHLKLQDTIMAASTIQPPSSLQSTDTSTGTSTITDKPIPTTLSKYFKTTAKARKLMDPEHRVCELDHQSHKLELVYSRHSAYHKDAWRQLDWSQAMLWQTAQDGELLTPLLLTFAMRVS